MQSQRIFTLVLTELLVNIPTAGDRGKVPVMQTL
jgi:hypothetical protein